MVTSIGPLAKVCKKCTADQMQKNGGNSPAAPTLIRDGGVGNVQNSCQIYVTIRSVPCLITRPMNDYSVTRLEE
jgi:hypothetical protein